MALGAIAAAAAPLAGCASCSDDSAAPPSPATTSPVVASEAGAGPVVHAPIPDLHRILLPQDAAGSP
jgi:hypothetical protein